MTTASRKPRLRMRLDGRIVRTAQDMQAERNARTEFTRGLGGRLRTLRGDRPRKQVALYLGVHYNTVAKFERGSTAPDAWQLLRLSRLFECNVADLIRALGDQP